MEALEKAFEREQRRIDPHAFDPVTVRTVDDVRRVIRDLEPSRTLHGETTTVATQLEAVDERGQHQVYQVSADTVSRSRRDILMEGFQLLRRRAAVAQDLQARVAPVPINGRPMVPASVRAAPTQMWIDPLIKRWLGGRREGEIICWDIDGYVYRYDIFGHRLTRVASEQPGAVGK